MRKGAGVASGVSLLWWKITNLLQACKADRASAQRLNNKTQTWLMGADVRES